MGHSWVVSDALIVHYQDWRRAVFVRSAMPEESMHFQKLFGMLGFADLAHVAQRVPRFGHDCRKGWSSSTEVTAMLERV